ncbi:S8 family serine peptidase [Fictibacillus barbaricus]|uniref:S8 family serine peptidase n=1 Tax=Fictibacillus barbaricus TaxID=182136 RepID=A0ABS2ZA61_9BACL|nr:S8 family serine peptidase [Fictibacillus barbaricus]
MLRVFLSTICLILIVSGLVPKIGFSQTFSFSKSITKQQGSNKINHKLTNQFEKEKFVTFIVKLKQQVNTPEIAVKIDQKSKIQGKSAFQTEIIKRSTIVSTLRTTAQETQHDLKQFLAKEKEEGRVKYVQSFYIVNAIAVTGTKEVVDKLASYSDVEKILLNETHQARKEEKLKDNVIGKQVTTSSPEWNIEKIGAPRAWKQGIDGTGTVVASIDTGVQWDHPSLKNKYRGYNPDNPDQPDNMFNWYDTVGKKDAPYDDHGHGTLTTGTMVGSAPDGNQIGVAPRAKWIAVKVMDSFGYTTDVNLLEAGEWILSPKDSQGNPHPEKAPDVVNNSWGYGKEGFQDQWYRQMVQAWRAADIFPVFAAGNYGAHGPGYIPPPAFYPESFAVAATDNSDRLARFSSRGPTPYSSGETKPDISAPGVNVRSAVPGNGYEESSGTSMAAPHIAGTVALLKQVNSSLSVDDLEALLFSTSNSLTDPEFPKSPNSGYGHGLINAYAAVQILTEGAGKLKGKITQTINGTPTGMSAKITVLESGRSTTTTMDGSYTLFQKPNEYTVQAEKYGYKTAKERVIVTKDGITTINFDLQPLPKGIIKGRITDPSNNPIENATISLIEDAAIAPVKTDKNGHFSISGYEGTYSLRVSAPYRLYSSSEVTIKGNKETEKNIVLKPFIGNLEEIHYDDGSAESVVPKPDFGDGYAVRMSLKNGKDKALLTGGIFMMGTQLRGSYYPSQFQVAVFDANGPDGAPGKKIAGPINANALSNGRWTHVDLTNESIIVNHDFYLVYLDNEYSSLNPRLSKDDNTFSSRSWSSKNGVWSKNSAENQYMIRAEVSYPIENPPTITFPKTSHFTNQNGLTVKGKGFSGTNIKIYNKGKEKTSIPTKADGSFSGTVILLENENVLTAVTTTKGGSTKPSPPIKVILDQVKPTLTIKSHVNGGRTNQKIVTIKGNVSDKYLDRVKVNGTSALISKDGTYSVRIPLKNGENVIQATAVDKAGNQQSKQILLFAKFTSPTIKNLKPSKDVFVKTGQTVKVELESQKGLTGYFSIRMPNSISVIDEVPLMEQKEGHYVGYWVVPSKLKDRRGAVIEVFMKDRYGNSTKKQTTGKLYINLRK